MLSFSGYLPHKKISELVNFYYMWKKKVGLKKKINGLTSSSKVFDLDADPGKKKDGKIANIFLEVAPEIKEEESEIGRAHV